MSKRRKINFKFFSRFSPDFIHFSLKHNGCKKKPSVSNSRKIACWFFSKVHNFFKTWWKSNIFSRGYSTFLELLWNKMSWWSYLISAPQIKKTKKKNPSVSTVQMTLKTLLLGRKKHLMKFQKFQIISITRQVVVKRFLRRTNITNSKVFKVIWTVLRDGVFFGLFDLRCR